MVRMSVLGLAVLRLATAALVVALIAVAGAAFARGGGAASTSTSSSLSEVRRGSKEHDVFGSSFGARPALLLQRLLQAFSKC